MENYLGVVKINAKPEDIMPTEPFPEFSQKEGEDLATYINRVKTFTERRTKEIIEWYIRKKRPVGEKARRLRALSIILVAFGGITPFIVAGKLLPYSENWTYIGYISLVLAATCIGFDNYFGYSESWMRFITTEFKLQTYLTEFQHEWAILNLCVANDKLDCKTCEIMLNVIKDFSIKVSTELENEAKEWTTKHSGYLSYMEKSIKDQNK